MSYVYLFPLSVYYVFQVTFILTYLAALYEGHVVPNIPYISDAATYSPESCFFGQAINMGSVLLGITIYIRYKQLQEVQRGIELEDRFKRLNLLALKIGILASFGISIVANFQETNVRVVHLFGALLCFGFGTIYFSMQTILTYAMQPHTTSMMVAHLRLFISMICVVFFMLVAIPGVISHIDYDGKDPRHWYPSDGGWLFHVISSVSEWIVATAFSFYILTFTHEFRNIHLEHPKVTFVITRTIILQEESDNIV